jgi:hypothetical protein
MTKLKDNRSIDFAFEEDNFEEILHNISSKNSINTSGSLDLQGHNSYYIPFLDKEELMKKREFFNQEVERYFSLY